MCEFYVRNPWDCPYSVLLDFGCANGTERILRIFLVVANFDFRLFVQIYTMLSGLISVLNQLCCFYTQLVMCGVS